MTTSKWQARAIRTGAMASVLGALMMMTGCAAMNMTETGSSAGGAVAHGELKGIVHGGQSPITGSLIGLYQVGSTSGYGTGAQQLLSSSVTTGTGGTFDITGQWTCTSGSYVYITASGGNPGNADSSNNNYIAMIAALGKCDNINSNTNVFIDEVTTVAAVWALQNFITITPGTSLVSQPGSYYGASTYVAPSFQIGAPPTNLQGMYNAFEVANVLANTSTGAAYGTSSGTTASGMPAMANAPGASSPLLTTSQQVVTVESYQIDAIADVLAACVNTEASSTTCSTMASGVIPSGTAPTDTLGIAYEMAKNPFYNVQTTFAYVTTISPFQTAATYEADWTIGYNVAYVSNPSGVTGEQEILNTMEDIKFDGFGNAYISSTGHGTVSGNSSDTPELTELDPAGNFVAVINSYNLGSDTSKSMVTMPNTTSTYNAAMRIAIDPSNNVYMPDYVSGNLMYVPAASSAGTTGAVIYPAGTVSVETGTASGTIENYYGYGLNLSTASSSSLPTAVTSDGAGNVFIAMNGSTAGTTFGGSGNKGIAMLVPSFSTGGPLTAGAGSLVSVSQGNNVQLFPAPAPASDGGKNTWGDGGFIFALSTSATCTGAKGELVTYFDKAGTSTGSSSSTTTTVGEAAPFVAITGTPTSGSCSQVESANGTWTGTGSSPATYTGIYPIDTGAGVGVDSSDNIWIWNNVGSAVVAGFNTTYLTELTPTYTTNATTGALALSVTPTIYSSTLQQGGTTFTGGLGLVVDGNNDVWVNGGNQDGTVLAYSASYVPSGTGATAQNTPLFGAVASTFPSGKYCTGLCGGYGSGAYRSNKWGTGNSMAIDLAGNIWAGQSGTGGNSINIIVGVAAPTVSPVSVAAKNHTFGTKP